jgi:2-keto-4-pentenoate hydratase/2-oxohepta-3-ene-1,7-dioic acid hydratase in catechol pathway
MKLITFKHNGEKKVGRLSDDRVLNVSVALPELPKTMKEILEKGQEALNKIKNLSLTDENSISVDKVELLAPIDDPEKFLAIGMNYKEHVEESKRKGIEAPKTQIWFNKQVSCITGPYSGVVMPAQSDMLDYELELAVVIGRECKNVSVEEAKNYIAGYMVGNDYSVRDVQWATPTWTLGKSFDTHGPLGPYLVTADEIEDPHNLSMELKVNGEIRQTGNSGSMVYNIYDQIAFLSQILTLKPGDIIETGTPEGVAAGMETPTYLKVGDVVEGTIEGLGTMRNKIVAS